MREALTFDDVLIVPQFSEIESRKDVFLTVNHSGFPLMTLPVISANMDTTTGVDMAKAMIGYGGQSVLHRFCTIEDNVKMFLDSKIKEFESYSQPMISVGLGNKELERAKALYDVGASCIVVDVANGAQQSVVDQVKKLRDIVRTNSSIVVGNFAGIKGIEGFLHGFSNIDGIKLGIGPGCFAAGTRILMSNGEYKNIEDIKLHDRVINKEGKSVEVIGTKFSGLRQVLKYKNNLFYKDTYVTPDHQHWVGDYSTIKDIDSCGIVEVLSKLDKRDNSKLKWKPISEHEKITLLMSKNIKFEMPEKFEINLDDFAYSRRNMGGLVSYPKIDVSYDLGYIFGTFLGDGCSRVGHYDRKVGDKILKNTSGSTAWYFGKEEYYIAEKLVRCIKNVFNMDAVIKERSNVWQVLNRNNTVSRLLLEFGKRKEKALPSKYFSSNKDYVKGLLDGLLDSDGSYGKDGRVSFGNTSSRLIEQFGLFFYLVNGYFPSMGFKEPTAGGLKNCNVENCNESFIAKSVTRPEFNDLGIYQINRLNSLDEEKFYLPTYDIEVDCSTHSFIANNAIVHNSACTTRLKTGIGYPQLSNIIEVCAFLKDRGYFVIADGGLKNSGDVAKAIGAGAQAVMLGNMLAGTDESPGEIFYFDKNGHHISKDHLFARKVRPDGTYELIIHDQYEIDGTKQYDIKKKYRGSASKESYEVQGKLGSHRTAEGESFLIPYKGPVANILQDIEGGLRSAMTYVGARTIKEFQQRCEFVRVTNAGYIEGTPHAKGIKL